MEEPGVEDHVPAMQFIQTPMLEAPEVEDQVPIIQSTHPATPTPEAEDQVPAPQLTQVLELVAAVASE